MTPGSITVATGLSGALLGLGGWMLVASATGRLTLPAAPKLRLTTAGVRAAGLAIGAGLGVALLTSIPVLGLLVGGLLWVGWDAFSGPSVPDINRLGEAIATWCETVRQELEAGQPLRTAVVTSCDLAPEPLAPALARLAARLGHQPLPDALWSLRADVDHAAIGPIIAALDLAYRRGAADVPRLMASQVEATRHRVAILRDVHAGRAKHRRAMMLLLGMFAVSILILLAVWRPFLAAYRPLTGELVLGGLGVTVLVSVRALVTMSQPTLPPDFFPDRPVPQPEPGAGR